MNKLGGYAKRKHINLDIHKGNAGCYNRSIWFMIDNNLIHVVNTSITDKAKRLHHHDPLLVYSATCFSVKLKRESLNRKSRICRMEKWNLNMPRNCKRKKYGLEDRFNEDMY